MDYHTNLLSSHLIGPGYIPECLLVTLGNIPEARTEKREWETVLLPYFLVVSKLTPLLMYLVQLGNPDLCTLSKLIPAVEELVSGNFFRGVYHGGIWSGM